MKNLILMTWRTVAERSHLILAAIFAGLVPFPLGLWAKVSPGDDLGFRREMVALKVAGIFVTVTSVLLGSTLLAKDLAQRRVGFYLARPISIAAFWGGRIVGSLIVLLGVEILVLAPAILSAGAKYSFVWIGGSISLATSATALLLLASYATISVKSRAAHLFAVDLVLLLAALVSVFLLNRRLARPGAWADLKGDLNFIAVSVLLGLLAASFAAVWFGRTELDRAHRAQLLTFLGILIGVVLVVLAGGAACRSTHISVDSPRGLQPKAPVHATAFGADKSTATTHHASGETEESGSILDRCLRLDGCLRSVGEGFPQEQAGSGESARPGRRGGA